MIKHTAGPWWVDGKIVRTSNEDQPRRAPIAQCAMSHGIGDAGLADQANAQRIVMCVNACEVMDDPDAEIAVVMENVRLLRIERDFLLAQRMKLLALAAGFMSESNHAMFADAANALLTRSNYGGE